MNFPFSLTLCPFVPHGERGLARRDVSSRPDIFAPKHQRNPKLQIPILPATSPSWSLGFGTFLVFGVWDLVFRPVGPQDSRS